LLIGMGRTNRKLLFQIKFNYVSSLTGKNLSVNGRNIREMAYIKAPNMSIMEYDENGVPTGEYFNPIYSYQGDGVTYFNPVAVANLGMDNSKLNRFENTFMLQYRVNSWMTLRETISFQYAGTKDKKFLPYNAIGADWLAWEINDAEEANSLDKSFRTETQMSFSSPFKNPDHQLSGAITWVTSQSGYEWMDIISNKVPSTSIKDPAVSADIGWIGNGSGESRLLSGIANLNYKFKDRYLLQTILRSDAHSSFGRNNRWGTFEGISIGWRFSEESFLSGARWLGESKLRASWGVSGRQPGDVYARFATYGSTYTGNYIMDPAIAPKSIQLNNLKWETVSSYDIGLELNLFNDRVYLEADVYDKITHNILFYRYQIPYSSGFDNLKYLNSGEMTNKGWELMGDIKIIRNKDWLFSVNFNVSQNINSFNRLPENFNTERSTSIGNGQYPKKVMEGEPIGSFYGFHYLGVWPSDADVVARDVNGNPLLDSKGHPIPLRYKDSYVFKGGDPIYEDVNHDGQIDLNDVVYLGDSNPNLIGGFGPTLRYKNLYFSAAFYFRQGFDIINGIAIQTEGVNDRNNQSKAVLSRWRAQGQDEPGMTPRAYMDNPANNLGSDRYVEKGDFLRLNNIKISYQLSKRLCQMLHIRRADLALSARKMYTWTRYSGQDPEVGQNAADPFWIGVDYARTPPPKVYTLSVGIGF
jgi:TonB-linked SusC/RagA family outer membrane protein